MPLQGADRAATVRAAQRPLAGTGVPRGLGHPRPGYSSVKQGSREEETRPTREVMPLDSELQDSMAFATGIASPVSQL